MKFKMVENSAFAILLRSPWWISALIAVAVFAASRFVLPTAYALVVPLPFVVIAGYAAWKQLRAPSAARIATTLEALRAMSWDSFSAALEDAFRGQGYGVQRLREGEADFELTRAGRLTYVSCRRWKAARTGVGPLSSLLAAARARKVPDCIYVSAGEISANARTFAAQNDIRLLCDAELAALLLRAVAAGKRAA
jgi:restriction system protein